MTDQPPADVTSPEAIQLRADARLTKRIKCLQNELDGKIAIIQALNSDLRVAKQSAQQQTVELQAAINAANEHIKILEVERDAALADVRYEQKCFAQVITAMQIARSGEYNHLIPALRRGEQTIARGGL